MQDCYREIVRFYDAENRDFTEDLAMYEQLLDETGGPVLDVGCGTGRVAFHLAMNRDVRVVGLDVSGAMLARARSRLARQRSLASKITFLEADIVGFEHTERFGLVVFAFNGFMHLSRQADQLAALARIAQMLRKDGGLLVIDLPNAAHAYATVSEAHLVFERAFADPETGNTVMQHSISYIERAAQMLSILWVYDVVAPDGSLKRFTAPLDLRYVFPAEMDLLLAGAGLARVEFYGGYDGAFFVDGAPRMITLARRRED